ncbi:hypothetical protein Tco_0618802 [Tanacetum coccineum]
MAFMCTVMANLLPSLATIDNKELLANIIALVVIVCIQIKTGVVSYPENQRFMGVIEKQHEPLSPYKYYYRNMIIAIIYVAMLLVLLIIQICSSLTITNSKRILELKFQAGHERALSDLELKRTGILTTKKLKQYVGYYWVMAETGSPQFMTACSATTSASGVIYHFEHYLTHSKCFASLSFKMSIKWIWEHIKVFKVECYSTHTLLHWKNISIPFPLRSRKCKVALENLKVLILSFSIGFQKTVVVTCKIISLIPIFLMVFVLLCSNCWKCKIVARTGLGTINKHKIDKN